MAEQKQEGGKKKMTAWMKHLMAVKKENPGKSLGECMKLAAKSYKK